MHTVQLDYSIATPRSKCVVLERVKLELENGVFVSSDQLAVVLHFAWEASERSTSAMQVGRATEAD